MNRYLTPLLVCLFAISLPTLAGQFTGGTLAGGSSNAASPVVYAIGDTDSSGTYTDSDIESVLATAQGENPEGGCAFVLAAETFTDVQIELPACTVSFVGMSETKSILQGPASPGVPTDDPDGQANGGVMLIEPKTITRDGLVLRRFTVDGNKQNLTSAAVQHNGIRIEDWTDAVMDGGLIENVHVRNTAMSGIYLNRVTNWTVRNGSVTHSGCWQNESYNALNEPGVSGLPDLDDWTPGDVGDVDDSSLAGCGPWGASLVWPTDVMDYGHIPTENLQLGRFTNGFGVEAYTGTSGTVVSGMTISRFTKIGIQVIDNDQTHIDDLPTGGRFDDNDISWGNSSGIATVRALDWEVTNNRISNINTAWGIGNVGKGIGCSHAGMGNEYRDNEITNVGGPGLDVGCACGVDFEPGLTPPLACDLVVTGNIIDGTCSIYTSGTAGAIDLRPTFWSAGPPADPHPTGITVADNTVTNNGCEAGLTFIRYDGLDMTSGDNSIQGGTIYGLFASEAENISVDASQFVGSTPVAGTGIWLTNTTTGCTVTGTAPIIEPGYTSAISDSCL